MRIVSFVLVTFFMGAFAVYPAQAESVTPAEAAQVIQAQLGASQTLSNGESDNIIAAFEAAATAHPEMAAELAQLVAAARPDLGLQLKASIIKIAPDKADSIIELMEQAANNPTVDQLAALAEIEGAQKPSAGHDNDNRNNERGEKDGGDLGWATHGDDHDGSAD